jgi:CelD/BcsL family acetyltransferase involved in cellulose biosynthesis
VLAPHEAAALAGEWRELAGRAVEPNHFFLPDVVLPAMRRFAQGVRVLAIHGAGGRLIAVAPVTLTRLGRIAPALRLWSHSFGPFGAPLVAAGAVEEAAALMIEAAPTVILPDVPLEAPLNRVLQQAARQTGRSAHVLAAHRRAALFRSTAVKDIRAALPTRRRKEFARQMRRLAEHGPVAIDSATAPDAVAAAFEEFLALEAAGWKGRGATAILSDPVIADFARTVVAKRAAAGGVRVDALRVGAKPIAVVVTFLAGTSAWTWKVAFDETHSRFSPGAQLMLDLPGRIFADERIERIDSLATADHPMIDHLWRDRLAIGTLVVGSGGPMHRLALLSEKAERRARAGARRLRERLYRAQRSGDRALADGAQDAPGTHRRARQAQKEEKEP